LDSLIGKPAPDFSLTDHNGKTYALTDLRGKNIVLFFNEGMMCYPACWNQIASLGADDRFKGQDVVALSVVVDSKQEWDEAVSQMPELGQAAVVHDNGRTVSSKYGVLTTKSSMHYGQLPGHTYVVIDGNGVIRHVYDDPNMAIHNNQLVDELKKLSV
jgi:peroxiredoxin Q/BCP